MSRKPLGYKPPDPKRRNNFLDSCAFDPDCATEEQASLEIFQKYKNDEFILHLAHSTQKEIEHPNTPSWVKNEANSFVYTLPTSLSIEEQIQKKRIWEILTGNGKPEKMKNDAEHVFEAGKYGGYFITTDARIIKKKQEIESICSVIIVKPTEFLEIFKMYLSMVMQ